VQQVVQRVLRMQYRDVSADLSLARLRTVRVYVVGEVVSPGAYDISSLSTPLILSCIQWDTNNPIESGDFGHLLRVVF
jgi:protein involved in polysaccharide export with SLBB domain